MLWLREETDREAHPRWPEKGRRIGFRAERRRVSAETVLKSKFPADVVDALLHAYREIEGNYALRKWKASELDAGHFVEAARRIVEHALTSKHTPIGTSLPSFNDKTLQSYENAVGDQAYRILIPRALKAVYNIRNKRGVGHVAGVSPNEMDATYILYTVKWVLAELVRLASGLSVPQTQSLVDEIVERRLSILWKESSVTKVLDASMRAIDQILVYLYDSSPQTQESLQQQIEYKNAAKFREMLNQLHRKKLIYHQHDGICLITPTGVVAAERIISKSTARLAELLK